MDKADADKVETSKAEIPAADAPRARQGDDHVSRRALLEPQGRRPASEAEPNAGMFGKRRLGALAAVVALAAVAGALGGAMATASFGHLGER